MEGDSEIYNFLKVWLSVFICLTYCYAIDKITPKASSRFLCILPILWIFLFLPIKLSSVHLGGITSFFIAWLANFKLLLFAFGKNPLSSNPPLSFPRFIAAACFPIRIRNPVTENPKNKGRNCKSLLNYSFKFLLLAALIRVYDYSNFLNKRIQLVLYCLHIFVVLELTLAIVAVLVRAVFGFGLELEPQFDEPYLSTSLQDFWGRRWNIMVSRILRPTVYEPVLHFCARTIDRRWASLPAVFSTFVVSAVMHEVIFYHLGRVRPTWEITWFFLFHGGCLVVEIALKKSLTVDLRLPAVVRMFLTVGFVIVTAYWWFFPPLLRCKTDVRAIEEYASVGAFVKEIGHVFTFRSVQESNT